MSKPDPAGGSLEAILASIRKSLAEQSGEAAAEQPNPSSEPEGDAKPARRHGLTERLAGAGSSAPEAPHNSDDLSDLLESPGDPPLSATPSNAAPTQPASPAPEDPLWFLSRREETKPAGGQSLLGLDRDAVAAAPPTEPSLTRPEVLRASMPPFFGSSDSTVTPPPAEAPAVPSGQPARPAPSSAAAAPAAAPPQAPAIEREVSLVAAAAESAAGRSASPGSSGPNGAAGAAPGDAPSNGALEAVVLELLKPMLRQWLDENMPRLVAQAISDEAVRARLPDGAKKP